MYYLSIDQGGTSSRAIVCDSSGKILSKGQCYLPTERDGVIVEQSAELLYESVLKSIHCCFDKLCDEQILHIQSASLVTQRSSFIAISKKTKHHLSNIISWQDSRAQKELEHTSIDGNWLRVITGLRASVHYGASKMKWCLEHNKKVNVAALQNDLMFLPLASFLVMKLTNNETYNVDPANAARTLLFDINTLQWQQELLVSFGIKKSYLPHVLSTLDNFGELTLSTGERVKPIPLKYVNGDQSAAIFAYGQPNEKELLINMGTGAFISRILVNNNATFTNTNTNTKALLRSIVHVDDKCKLFVLEGTVNGCGAAIEHMASILGIDSSFLNDIENIKGEIPLFINAVGGLGAPYWRTDIESRFIGVGVDEGSNESIIKSTNEEKLIAVLESIAFLVTVLMELLSKPAPQLESIILSGGMSNNAVLCQMLADLSGYQVKCPSEVEASALGSIWWLANRPKKWLPELKYQFYLPQENSHLKNRYQLWKAEMDKLLK